ncbi:MAG: hypothetical protein RLZZ221_341 [Verrucomicrobiota bacterium]
MMRIPLSASLAAWCFLLSGVGICHAESNDSETVRLRERTSAFARHLESIGQPAAAAQEYLRSLWLGGDLDDSLGVQAAEGIARAYFMAGEYEATIRWSRNPALSDWSTCSRLGIEWMAARASLRMSAAPQALDILTSQAADSCTNLSTEDRARWTYLQAVAYAHHRDWDSALQRFSAVPSAAVTGASAQQGARIAQEALAFEPKSPNRASWLGIVPGAGYIYAGFPKSGISALIVNAVFAQATREAFRHDQNTLGWFMGVLTASWYVGSIYGSGASANRYNEYHQDAFLKRLSY